MCINEFIPGACRHSVDTVFSKACREIASNLLDTGAPTKRRAESEIKSVCAKYSLDRIPRNHEILAETTKAEYARLKDVLVKKPAKTASGVAVVALMPRPYACPHGRCTYCPGGPEYNSPNSYTGKEPVTMTAMSAQYDPKMQIAARIKSLVAFGHEPTKLELVIVGGTFLFMPPEYQEHFIKSCYDALNGADSDTLEEAKSLNERAAIRNVGFTIETKPDYCKAEHVDTMLRYGITRVEIGVQSLHDRVYKIVNRGHDYNDVTESFRISRDAGYKTVAHMMPGLPTMTPKEDIADFERLFADEELKPDMLKIYPALVVGNTQLAREYDAGRYRPYSDEEAVRVLATVKRNVPRWVRIMRIQREISPGEIDAGPKHGNLRQMVHEEMARQGVACQCIRCREIGRTDGSRAEELNLRRIDYTASGGDEVFLSYEDSDDHIYGFLRLRRPSHAAHRPEVSQNTCMVRELHVLGRPVAIGARADSEIQHTGLGRNLMMEAERIAREEFDARRMLVISAVGTREYYQKTGYSLYGPYMAKALG